MEILPEYSLCEDWKVYGAEELALHFKITLTECNSVIPKETEWYAVISKAYPLGPVFIYPSQKNGITATFPHQSFNGNIIPNRPWRSGGLCLSDQIASIGMSIGQKPPAEAKRRLFWYIERTIRWLQCAIREELILEGDPFEAPDFPCFNKKDVIVYNEDLVSSMQWEDCVNGKGATRSGQIEYHVYKNTMKTFYVPQKYTRWDHTAVYEPRWGAQLSRQPVTQVMGLWVLLNKIPVVNVWQAPTTFGELCRLCLLCDVDLRREIIKFSSFCRDGRSHPVSVGYPAPKYIGEENKVVLWSTFLLPTLSCGKKNGKKKSSKDTVYYNIPNGFRPGEKAWRLNDKNIITEDMKLNWAYSENWAADSIVSRGALPRSIRGRRILLIGCGSLGSCVAELLARGGVATILCVDSQTLDAGNLCRHTLTMNEVGREKAEALAEHLITINPQLSVSYYAGTIFQRSTEGFLVDAGKDENPVEILDSNYDILIDTTGEDSLLSILETELYKRPKIFLTTSISLGAKHLFLYAVCSTCPSFEDFLKAINTYNQNDYADTTLKDLPRDGIGCWHPLFPARGEDMWLAAVYTIKFLERYLASSQNSAGKIYELCDDKDGFQGYQSKEIF